MCIFRLRRRSGHSGQLWPRGCGQLPWSGAPAWACPSLTDVSSHLMITLWGPTNSQIASVTVSIPATSSHYEIVIPYSDLAMTNGTLTNVGAIELKVDAPPSVDIVLFYFGIIGE